MSFNFTDIVLFLGVSQGIFLAISLQLIHNRNKGANRVLSWLLLISVVMLFARISTFRIPAEWVWRFGILVDTSLFLFGPLVFLYVRKMLFSETRTPTFKWVHYIPAILHLSYYLWTLSIPLQDFNAAYAKGALNLQFFIVEAAGLIFFVVYWIKTYLLLAKYRKEEKKQLSFRQTIFTFLGCVMGALLLSITLWGISFVSVQFFRVQIPYLGYTTMWISTPLFIYIIGYFSLRQPEIFRISISEKNKTEKDRLKPEEIQQLQKRLNYFMSEEAVYIQPDLTLKSLAEKLHTSPNNLSWLLNQVYQATFYEYVNGHRINAFIKRLENEEHRNHTLLSLAMDVGFNSKSTFNKAFKAVKGQTPSQFIKNQQVA